MAEYLIQDTALDAIADAINAKTGGSSAMTPAEMVTAIGSIPSGTTITNGIVVKEKASNGYPVEIDLYGDAWSYMFGTDFNSTTRGSELTTVNLKSNNVSIKDCAFSGSRKLTKIDNDKIVSVGVCALSYTALTDGNFPNLITAGAGFLRGNTTITDIFLPKLQSLNVEGLFTSAQSVQTIQVGSVGYGVTSSRYDVMFASDFSGIITIYCAGNKVDEIVTNIRRYSSSCTIIIKASEQTEYNGTSYVAGDTILTSEVT